MLWYPSEGAGRKRSGSEEGSDKEQAQEKTAEEWAGWNKEKVKENHDDTVPPQLLQKAIPKMLFENIKRASCQISSPLVTLTIFNQ